MTAEPRIQPTSWRIYKINKYVCMFLTILLLIIFFEILFLAAIFSRWGPWISDGWSAYHKAADEAPLVPGIKDATVAAIFVLLMCVLPSTFHELKYLSAKTKSEMGTLKAESPINNWRFLDKNTHYGYLFLFGAGVALNTAVRVTKLNETLAQSALAKLVTGLDFKVSVLVVLLVALVFANTMTGVAACCVVLPFVLNMAPGPEGAETLRRGEAGDWTDQAYIGALGVGLATTFGFMVPFRFTPAYYCHSRGKVPIKKMMTYSLVPLVLSLLVLWGGLVAYAPFVWDPKNEGIKSFTITPPTTTTAAGIRR